MQMHVCAYRMHIIIMVDDKSCRMHATTAIDRSRVNVARGPDAELIT
jgi:hypothetical protein